MLLKLFELAPECKKYSIPTNQKYLYWILKRNSYSFRTKTYQGQTLPKNCFTQTSIFLNNVWDKRIDNKYLEDIIGNIDETPIFVNMVPSKIISKKGENL